MCQCVRWTRWQMAMPGPIPYCPPVPTMAHITTVPSPLSLNRPLAQSVISLTTPLLRLCYFNFLLQDVYWQAIWQYLFEVKWFVIPNTMDAMPSEQNCFEFWFWYQSFKMTWYLNWADTYCSHKAFLSVPNLLYSEYSFNKGNIWEKKM